MAMPPIQKQLIEKRFENYCRTKIPIEIQDKVKLFYKMRGNSVTLIESRPVWNDPSRWTELFVAQVRYENETGIYTLFYANQNNKWFHYEFLDATGDLDEVIDAIENDSTGIFWG